MTKHQKVGLFIAILSVIGLISAILLFNVYFNHANTDSSYLDFDGVDDKDDLLEVSVPMSCTYRGKLKLDIDTQSSLKKYQKVLSTLKGHHKKQTH